MSQAFGEGFWGGILDTYFSPDAEIIVLISNILRIKSIDSPIAKIVELSSEITQVVELDSRYKQ